MTDDIQTCERCGTELDEDNGLCPECDVLAPDWMVWLVYGLGALFVIGLVYRLVWP